VKLKRFDEYSLNENLAKNPVDLKELDSDVRDMEILRFAISAEIDAINLYEQMASTTENKDIKETLLNIAKEEKTHIGEFESLLLELDKDQKKELNSGKKEVKKEVKK
jgi:rubrerythrin